jgi:hypothetical protein
VSAGLPLITAVDFGNAVQYVEPPRLPGDVGVVIMFGQDGTCVIVAVFRRDLLQLIEELVQFSPSKPPIEQVADLLCWAEAAGIEAASAG